jgi:proteasome accessory factor B
VDKLERLLNLTAALLHTARPLTAEELRERVQGYPENFASFRRAFERDKEDLREMGIPISVESIEGAERPIDGYRIHHSDYYLRDPGLDPEELAAINLALSAVRLEGIQGVEALWKLGGVVEGDEQGRELASLPTDPSLVPLFAAIVECRPVTFSYRGSERTSERTLEPYRLDYQRGRWYASGRDRLTGEIRHFRLDRVEGGITVGDAAGFDRPAEPTRGLSQPWEFGEGEAVIARLLVDAEQAPWAQRHLGADHVVGADDEGSVVFEVPVTNWPAFRSFVLTFLDHAELLGPPELRAELVDWLRQSAAPPEVT